MKRLLLLSILMCASFGLVGQTVVDRFTSYDEMAGKAVWFYNVDLMRDASGDFIYQMDSAGKIKKVYNSSIYTTLSSEEVLVSGVYKYKGKNYLQVYISGTRYYLLIGKNNNYLMNTRSASYWKQLAQDALKYKYISTSSYIVRAKAQNLEAEEYASLRWGSLKRPQSLDEEVYMIFTTSYNSVNTFKFKAQDFEFFRKDFVVVKPAVTATSVSSSENNDTRDKVSAMDANRVFDANLQLGYSVRNFLSSKGEAYVPDETIPFAVYGYSNGEYLGYLLGYEYRVSANNVTIFSNDAKYLKERGNNGMTVRKEQAKKWDAENVEQYNKRIEAYNERLRQEEEQARLQVEKDKKKSREILQYLRKNRVIIGDYNVGESYSDYYLKLEVHNWFSKRIKYLDLTVMAVNSVGDPRWYDKNRSVKNIQCIGYIESLSIGTYRFDDLFYDSSEVIDDIIVCGAVITFEDNSKITIDSQAAAAKMYVENHNIELPDNFFQYIR